ncbi:hypothetical protein, partial [Clostridium tagluense]
MSNFGKKSVYNSTNGIEPRGGCNCGALCAHQCTCSCTGGFWTNLSTLDSTGLSLHPAEQFRE